MNNRLINTKVAGGGGCTDIVDNYDPFGGNGVALYQLNGDATDVSGNYNGTALNVTYGTGVFGQAGVFNGSSSSIVLPTAVIPADNFSISMWVNSNDVSTQNNLITQYVLAGGSNGRFVFIIDGSYFQAYVESNGSGTNFNYVLSNNTWYHVTLIKSGSWECFVNGTSVGTWSDTVNITTSYNTQLGSRVSSTDALNGKLDQVRIFNTALTPLEVEALYTEELCICDGTVDTLDILGDGSCIATYQLDGNANDLSGNYSGTPTDISYGVGEFDLAGVFNGSTSYITLGTGVIPVNSSYSFTFWLYRNSGDDRAVLFTQFQSSQTNRMNFEIETTTGKLYFATAISGADNIRKSTTYTVPFDQWEHIAVTRSGTSLKFYVNGSEIATTLTSGTDNYWDLKNYTTQIGTYNNLQDSRILNGSIDQVRIFNKALSSSEVTTLYNETACTKSACTGTTNTLDILGDGSCVATYPLDGSPADLSGNYNGVQTDVTYPQGYFDLAGSFGVASRIETSLHFNGTTVQGASLSAWFKGSPDNSFYIAQPKTLNSPGAFFGRIIIGNYTGDFGDESIGVISSGSSTLAAAVREGHNAYLDNQWHHIVVTSTLTTKNIYIDGQNKTLSYSDGFASTNLEYKDLMIHGNNSGDEGSGSIDQVRIFNKALSAGEVTTLYNETPCN